MGEVQLDPRHHQDEDGEVLRSLDDQQLTPATLAVREPSLDDVFLALTGRRADDEVAGDGHGSGAGAT